MFLALNNEKRMTYKGNPIFLLLYFYLKCYLPFDVLRSPRATGTLPNILSVRLACICHQAEFSLIAVVHWFTYVLSECLLRTLLKRQS